MARLIDADQFKAKLLSFMDRKSTTPSDTDCILDGVLNLLEEQPTIDPVKHGHWIDTGRADYYLNKEYRCSCCNSVDYLCSPYCYNCGARMDGEKHE